MSKLSKQELGQLMEMLYESALDPLRKKNLTQIRQLFKRASFWQKIVIHVKAVPYALKRRHADHKMEARGRWLHLIDEEQDVHPAKRVGQNGQDDRS